MKALAKYEPTSVSIVCLMFKTEAYKMNYEIKYHAFTVSNLFIVGFGLDYNQIGRNLPDIYQKYN
jgi:hypoxanthine-guanine phosphoribosyltransferase